ncbi:hypothetical protein M3J09_012116 [Ascochyta lentis]
MRPPVQNLNNPAHAHAVEIARVTARWHSVGHDEMIGLYWTLIVLCQHAPLIPTC